ncbi:MAG: hypothetical protein EPN91_08165 [Salinibacterium sp.]|nr:MAG: hypothetical protein EPN91_08165 [Salinibacterium sp.]
MNSVDARLARLLFLGIAIGTHLVAVELDIQNTGCHHLLITKVLSTLAALVVWLYTNRAERKD